MPAADHSGLVIDAWMQQPTAHFLRQPYFDSLRRWAGSDELPEVPLVATVAAMQQAGVAFGLLSAWYGPKGVLISNDEVAACVQQYPAHLAGIASVDISQPMQAVRELRRCVNTLGFKGLRVLPWLWGLPPDDRRYYPLYAECIELGIPFCTQIGHAGPLLSSEPGRPIPYLENVALEFPELTIVGGHLGAPWVDEVVSLAHKCANFYIDTSAYKASRFPESFVKFMRSSGCKKVLFGSNYPMINPADCLQDLDELELDAAAKQKYLSANALKVFKLNDIG